MAYLNKQRTKESYFDKLCVKSKGTIRNTRFALTRFETFLKSRYGDRSTEEIVQELSVLKDDERVNSLYDLLKDFVNYMNS
ncbi:MAG: hypothetical protein ACT4N1_03850, partial [Nitrososphaerota archaeon]